MVIGFRKVTCENNILISIYYKCKKEIPSTFKYTQYIKLMKNTCHKK